MQDKHHHFQEVKTFLQQYFGCLSWEFTYPRGTGNETYFARGNEKAYFVKLGVPTEKYLAMASIGLTPQVLAAGSLEDGTSIIVQPYITGRYPSRQDYREHLDQFAAIIRQVHHSPELTSILPKVSSDLCSMAGLEVLASLQKRWEMYKPLVPEVANFVDESLTSLEQQVRGFSGKGLVASHNDICNGNWIITPDEELYLIDLDSMSIDDPAIDIGATLWWYYPPDLWYKFLQLTDHANEPEFKIRMQVRMTMHCLHIILPREQSFDRFDPATFPESLTDFRASLAGKENPKRFND
jgi:thiamine kinase-like enzyme